MEMGYIIRCPYHTQFNEAFHCHDEVGIVA